MSFVALSVMVPSPLSSNRVVGAESGCVRVSHT
jgi:hypothetical protein